MTERANVVTPQQLAAVLLIVGVGPADVAAWIATHTRHRAGRPDTVFHSEIRVLLQRVAEVMAAAVEDLAEVEGDEG